jgi:hypothetical protein
LRADAAKQATRLEPRVPKYVIKAAATPELTITINGQRTLSSGLPVPIDPGPAVIVASAPNHEAWKHNVEFREGATITIDVPALTPAKVVANPPPPRLVDRGKGRRRIALGVGAVGVVALGVGSVFGLQARSKFSDAERACGGSVDACDPQGLVEARGLVGDARSKANLSSILWGVGAGAAVVAVVLYVTAPSKESASPVSVAPQLLPDGGGITVGGRF